MVIGSKDKSADKYFPLLYELGDLENKWVITVRILKKCGDNMHQSLKIKHLSPKPPRKIMEDSRAKVWGNTVFFVPTTLLGKCPISNHKNM